MLVDMDDAEIGRLRKAIRRTYASQPHKIKCWLALLEMYGKNSPDPAEAARGVDLIFVPGVPLRTRCSSRAPRTPSSQVTENG
jgi:hypothetical protein